MQHRFEAPGSERSHKGSSSPLFHKTTHATAVVQCQLIPASSAYADKWQNAMQAVRLLEAQDTLPPIPQDNTGSSSSSSSPAPADSSSPLPDSGTNPVAIHVDSPPPDSPAQSGGETGGGSPAPPTDSTSDVAGAAFTSGRISADDKLRNQGQDQIL